MRHFACVFASLFPALVCLVLVAAPLRGEAQEMRRSVSYTSHILAVDLAGAGAGVAAALLAEPRQDDFESRLGLFSSTFYGIGVVGAPAVHWAHQRPGVGFGSLSLRFFGPPIGGLTGLVVYCVGSSFGRGSFAPGCARRGSALGFAGAAVGGAVLDQLLFARSNRLYDMPSRSWYGWQTLAVDGLGLGLGAVVLASVARKRAQEPPQQTQADEPQPALAPVALWASHLFVGMIGVPIVHLFHAEWLSAAGSFAMRFLGAPLLGVIGAAGYCAAVGGTSGCMNEGLGYSMLGGSLVAIAMDGAWLGWEDAPEAEEQEGAPPTPTAQTFVPAINYDGERLTFGISGRFE